MEIWTDICFLHVPLSIVERITKFSRQERKIQEDYININVTARVGR